MQVSAAVVHQGAVVGGPVATLHWAGAIARHVRGARNDTAPGSPGAVFSISCRLFSHPYRPRPKRRSGLIRKQSPTTPRPGCQPKVVPRFDRSARLRYQVAMEWRPSPAVPVRSAGR